MKSDLIYNASDFPLDFRIVIPPNSAIEINDLLASMNDSAAYVYITNSALVDADRILDIESVRLLSDKG